jgi:Tfp pilus assembly protein PilF
MSEEMTVEQAQQIMDEAIDRSTELLESKPAVAELILKQVLRIDPEHPAGLQLLGLAKHRQGQNTEAIEIFQTALELDPHNADNYNDLGLPTLVSTTTSEPSSASKKPSSLNRLNTCF